jgi:succinate-semialdehyde dehydrogenase / glutarate-semialdehyde dehydrogenase
MPPSSCIVESATELTPTVAGANSRAATTQYSSPTAEVSPELSTKARPSRATGLILATFIRPESPDGENRANRPPRPAGGTTFSSTRTRAPYCRGLRPPGRGGSIGAMSETPGSDREQAVLDAVPTGLFIGGSWRPATSGAKLAVDDPSTGKTLVEVADATPDDGRAALDAAVAAQPGFAAMPPRERGEILRRAFDLIMSRIDDLALLMTLEMGKPIAESKGEITYAAEFFRWFAEEAVRIDGQYAVAPNGASRFLVMRQPVGVCLLVTPWNFPMAMGTRKIGPAVAAGCTMVIKPAQQTPLSMHALAAILAEAGLPDGVLNVVTTSSAGKVMEPLIRDGRARKLSFTGSTGVGRALLEQAADKVLRTSMELGGNAPFLVFADADLDAAVEGAMTAKMRNMGEACTAANRFLVHRSVAGAFADKLAERMAALRVGRGTDDGVQVGPLVDAKSREKVVELVGDAVDRGATVRVGGDAVDGPGWFYRPTVLTGVPLEARLTKEEIFGPVAPISVFDTDDEAVAAANDTEFGLVSYLFTENLSRALRVSEALESGMVGLNTGLVSNPAAPFGGIKQSGLGREGGSVGIEEYLETKYVAVNL